MLVHQQDQTLARVGDLQAVAASAGLKGLFSRPSLNVSRTNIHVVGFFVLRFLDGHEKAKVVLTQTLDPPSYTISQLHLECPTFFLFEKINTKQF